MIATIETGSPKVVGVKLSGKLHDEDYRRFVPMIESILTAEGKVRLFVQFEEFQGWDMHAAWDDFKFALNIIPTSSGSLWSATADGKSGWRAFASRLPRPR